MEADISAAIQQIDAAITEVNGGLTRGARPIK
jgi:hypothetical protein